MVSVHSATVPVDYLVYLPGYHYGRIGLIMVLVEVYGPPKQSTSMKSTIRRKENGKEIRICTNNYYSNYVFICSYIWPEPQFTVSKKRISSDNITSDDVCLFIITANQ